MSDMERPFRIGLFIDGFTFQKVNNYYLHFHWARSRIRISGLRNFVMHQVRHLCPAGRPMVLEAHYYHPHQDPAKAGGKVFEGSRRFEERLQENGIQMHYLSQWVDCRSQGNSDLINDIRMFASFEEIDVVVLVSTQGFYADVAKMLQKREIPLYLLGWNFDYSDAETSFHWRTDSCLRERAARYFPMEQVMDYSPENLDAKSLFLSHKNLREFRGKPVIEP